MPHGIVEHGDELVVVDIHALVNGNHVLAFIEIWPTRSRDEELGSHLLQCCQIGFGESSGDARICRMIVDQIVGNPLNAFRAAEPVIQ